LITASAILTTPTPFLLEMSSPCGASAGQDAGGDGVDSQRVVGECSDLKSLILLRRFYTRSAAAGSKYGLVKVSPVSVKGMPIGDDPTARR